MKEAENICRCVGHGVTLHIENIYFHELNPYKYRQCVL